MGSARLFALRSANGELADNLYKIPARSHGFALAQSTIALLCAEDAEFG